MTDIINGLFEIMGGFFILPSILKVLKTKRVEGVSYLTTGFFTSWGLWNIYFYSHHSFTLSLLGGIFLSITNLVWLLLILKYK